MKTVAHLHASPHFLFATSLANRFSHSFGERGAGRQRVRLLFFAVIGVITNNSISLLQCLACALLLLFTTTATAQTLVNKAWIDTSGHPSVNINHQAITRDAGYVVVAGTSYSQGQSNNIYVAKYNLDGVEQWKFDYNSDSYFSDVLTDVCIKDGYVYTAGFIWDSINNESSFLTLKFNYSNGNLVWYKNYPGPYGGHTLGTAVKVDNAGNVYICGSEEIAGGNLKTTVIKYNSAGTQQWIGSYDSLGLYDIPAVMVLDSANHRVIVGGGSGSAFSSWDFTACMFNDTTGALLSSARFSNGNGSFSQPVALVQDYGGNTIIGGTACIAGANTDFKIIKYDTLYSELWVRTWGNADSLPDEAAGMVRDLYSNYIITGTVTKPNGGKDIVTLRYDYGGTLLWSRTISAPNPGHKAIAKEVTTDAQLNVYVTGKVFNGTDYDFATFSYDPTGNLRWYKTYDGGEGSNDQGFDLVIDDATQALYASGRSEKDTTIAFVTIKYEQQPDSLGLGVLIPSYVTDRIKYSDYVFEGTVIQTNSYFNHDSNFIYTSNIINVSRVFKGEIYCGTIELITLGGTVDSQTLLLSHNIELNVGEVGVFLTKQTTRELSAIDFYTETNDDKIYMPYGEEGFIKYYYDGINPLVCQQWGKWNTLTPLHNLLENTCGEEMGICEEAILPPTEIGTHDIPFQFPRYTKQQFDAQMLIANQRASQAIHSADRALGTITYNFSNPVISGTSTKYLEFDVQLSDNISSGWFTQGVVHILYNTSVFGSDIVTNNKIEVTRGTVTASADDYMDPIPNDFSTGVVAISMVADTAPLGLYELTNTPINAIHVKMEIANCNVSNVTISMTNNTNMLNVSLYSPVPNPTLSTNLERYGVVDNTSTFAMPACKPKILSFSPPQVNAGVGDTLRIIGYQFGATRGSGGVYMKNCDDGGQSYICLDSYDYISWSDTLIRVIVPSAVDTLNIFNNGKGGAGSGNIIVKTSTNDSASSSTALNVFYSIRNTVDSFCDRQKKIHAQSLRLSRNRRISLLY